MTWYKRIPEKDYFVRCGVCGDSIDTRKPNEVFKHQHIFVEGKPYHKGSLHFILWACWPGYDIVTPSGTKQKAYLPSKVCLN